jgi:FkbM family methyltransferase
MHGERLWSTTKSGIRLRLDPTDPMQLRLYLYGAYSERELQVLSMLVQPGDVCVDVGAHIGLFSLELARAAGPTGRVIAFEPAPDTRARLMENLDANQNGARVAVRSVALSDTSGRMTLHSPEDAADVGRRSLVSGGEGVEVEVVRFDDLDLGLDRLDIVKVDVEGAEALVLEGMRGSIERFRPRAFLLETEEMLLGRAGIERVDEIMRSHGYEKDPRIGGSNSLYVTAGRDRTS